MRNVSSRQYTVFAENIHLVLWTTGTFHSASKRVTRPPFKKEFHTCRRLYFFFLKGPRKSNELQVKYTDNNFKKVDSIYKLIVQLQVNYRTLLGLSRNRNSLQVHIEKEL